MEVKEQDGKIEIPSSLGHNNTFPSSSLPSNQNHGKNVLLNSPITQTLNQNHIPNPLQYSLRPRRSDFHHQTLDPPTSTDTAASSVRYRECLKNHAAKTGGHVLDGCGEFMPAGEDATPESLTCAACECHRSFHRRESQSQSQHALTYYYNYHNSVSAPPSSHFNHHHHQQIPAGAPVMMTFGGAVVESSSEDLDMYRNSNVAAAGREGSSGEGRKKRRVRTKFSEEQKMKMMEFANKIGWKIHKKDEQQLEMFCCEVGVKRQVFKVWMHNNNINKNT